MSKFLFVSASVTGSLRLPRGMPNADLRKIRDAYRLAMMKAQDLVDDAIDQALDEISKATTTYNWSIVSVGLDVGPAQKEPEPPPSDTEPEPPPEEAAPV